MLVKSESHSAWTEAVLPPELRREMSILSHPPLHHHHSRADMGQRDKDKGHSSSVFSFLENPLARFHNETRERLQLEK